ncbi:Flp family type IVb pilin [Acidithiobacillus sulfurivorans]|jgi:Flp pilus assembly pilin Flp|uniref:Pilus assembly protein n=1 Tax=Acidithiobacillus sulfurivorans TaxID=1958756 RepID=A0ABS6A5U2_9PROT|nr:pilus assembly protein [Acidithiobacillus sulfurivorans]MBU2761730.1 pilus assembly protein [Acidithiobacillus sulfurivorans]
MKPLHQLQRNRRSYKSHDESGQGMTEYLIITALIAVAAIGVFAYFGQTIRDQISGLAEQVSGQSSTTQVSSAQTAAGKAVTSATAQKNLSNYNAHQDGQ